MNTRKTVYDKLFTEKVELAKHEVELASIDELKKLVDNSEAILKTYNTSANNFKSAAKTIVRLGDEFRDKTGKINDLASTLKKQFADLGLNYLDNADVKIAIALLQKDFDVRSFTDSARQIK